MHFSPKLFSKNLHIVLAFFDCNFHLNGPQTEHYNISFISLTNTKAAKTYHTKMERKLLYAFRGWIAFVAFMDLGTAFRSYIERRSFLGDHTETQFIEGDYTISRIIGMYCLLKAIALVHCTLYIHYKPVVSMGGCSLALTMVLYASEALYFRSSTLNFYVIFPCVLNSITLVGLIYIPKRLRLWEPHLDVDDENSQLLKQMTGYKRRRTKKQP